MRVENEHLRQRIAELEVRLNRARKPLKATVVKLDEESDGIDWWKLVAVLVAGILKGVVAFVVYALVFLSFVEAYDCDKRGRGKNGPVEVDR